MCSTVLLAYPRDGLGAAGAGHGARIKGVITIRRFRIYRPNAPEGHLASGAANAPDEVQLEGCLFSDGTVSVRWMTQFRSFSNWDSWAAFDAVHGHPEYGTVVDWLDGDLDGDVDANGPPLGRQQIKPAGAAYRSEREPDPGGIPGRLEGMAWSLAYEKLTGRRHPEQDELVPKAGMPEYDSQGLATFLADRYAQTLGHRSAQAPTTKDWATGRDLYTLQDGRLIKPDTTKGGESP